MADNRFSYEEEEEPKKGGDNLFLWTVFILLLIGIAFACWLGSFYIFGHPEQPRAYRILQKVKRIETPRRFEVTAAPPGEFLSAQRLFERYAGLKDLELERENANLLRDYIKNYRETKKLVPYMTGRFKIVRSYALTPKDVFESGVVTLAQSTDFPQALIEHIYTAPPEHVPALLQVLPPGLDLTLKRTDDCAAVIHVAKTPDGRLKFTVLSLLYGTYALKNGEGTFSLEPPRGLNIEAGFPVVKLKAYAEATRALAEQRRGQPVASANTGEAPELVRVETTEPGAPVPEKGSMPPVTIATPIPLPGRTTPRPIAVATPIPVATPVRIAMAATPPPPVETPRVAENTTPPPPRMAPSGVPLQPFNRGAEVVARPDPAKMPATGATWRTFAPGQIPEGRTLTAEEVGALADRGMINERTYLRGSFRVTATGTNRAVLRDAFKSDAESPRVMVEYPAGSEPPAEKQQFERDATRPFQVYDVRRGPDGVVTIYVREIMQDSR